MSEESSREDKEVPQHRGVRNIRIGIAISLGVLLAILLIAGLWSLVAPTTPTERKDVVQAVGVLLAAIAGLVGLFFTAQNVRTNQRTLQGNLKNTQRTLELTEQGQITERFTRAIEQLGETDDKEEPKIEIRLGGIYALERIAKDSPERDYATIMEVLTAYIRENASLPSEAPTEPPSEQNEAAEQSEDAKQSFTAPQEKPRADIQAILDVLGRRQEARAEEHLGQLDLQETNLIGANLRKANLRKANLIGAILWGAILSEADLWGAILWGAILWGADLRGAILWEANLIGANLQGANLQGAILEGAILWEANLWGAILWEANLREANLQGANLQGANLRGANLQGANLWEANLWGAEELTQDQLEQAFGDETTKLPEGRHLPASWTQVQDGQGEGEE